MACVHLRNLVHVCSDIAAWQGDERAGSAHAECMCDVPAARCCPCAAGKPRRIGGSKKPPKRRKKQKDGVAVDFDEASTRPDAAVLRQLQSDTLEVLFEVFFRVLKQTAASGLAAPDRPGGSLYLTPPAACLLCHSLL